MLQSVEPSLDRVGHGFRAMDVSGSGQTQPVGLLDHGPQGAQIVLGVIRLAPGGDVAPADHDLDHVTSTLGPFLDGVAQANFALRLSTKEVAMATVGRY